MYEVRFSVSIIIEDRDDFLTRPLPERRVQCTEVEKKVLLSRIQVEPGRTAKQKQEKISPNHVPTIFSSSVVLCTLT